MSFFRTASLYGNFRYSHTSSMLRSSNCHMPRITKKILRLSAGSRNSYFTKNPAPNRICRETERLIQAALVFFVQWTLHRFSDRIRKVCSTPLALFFAANNFYASGLVEGRRRTVCGPVGKAFAGGGSKADCLSAGGLQ